MVVALLFYLFFYVLYFLSMFNFVYIKKVLKKKYVHTTDFFLLLKIYFCVSSSHFYSKYMVIFANCQSFWIILE